ncbi:UTP--glucose-1-phosphate uridylyltransferase GalU [Planctomycetales bacterium]|nr:UTP--glucose-1-phosphate uridylyltransferase GalU [Planctomycetales bacterium]
MLDLAVIPAAGRGLNFLPLTKSQPKEMLPLGNKPVVQYVVEELIQNDVRRILFITGPDKSAIENHFDTNKDLIRFLRVNGKEEQLAELAFERNEAAYFYTRQRHQNGLGQAVLCAEPFVQEQPFIVALGDTILGRPQPSRIVQQISDLFIEQKGAVQAVIAFDELQTREYPLDFGIAKPGKNYGNYFEVDDIVEKPAVNEAPSNLAVAARYVFSPDIFRYLRQTNPGINGEVQLTDAIQALIRDGGRVLGVPLPEQDERYDIGTFGSYYRAFAKFAL